MRLRKRFLTPSLGTSSEIKTTQALSSPVLVRTPTHVRDWLDNRKYHLQCDLYYTVSLKIIWGNVDVISIFGNHEKPVDLKPHCPSDLNLMYEGGFKEPVRRSIMMNGKAGTDNTKVSISWQLLMVSQWQNRNDVRRRNSKYFRRFSLRSKGSTMWPNPGLVDGSRNQPLEPLDIALFL